MKKTISSLEDILKIITTSSLILIIGGFFDLKLYYARFGININEYIGASEILLSSIDKLAFVLFAILIQLGIWLYLFEYLFDYNLSESLNDGERRPRKYHDETIHRFIKSKFLRIYFVILFIGTFITLAFYACFPTSVFWYYMRNFFGINLWVAMCIYLGWLQGTKNLWDSLKSNEHYNAKVIVTLIVFVTIFASSVWIKNSFLVNHIRKHGTGKNIELFLNENIRIASSDTSIYIGRTENYFFFWNKITHEATIYPNGEVKRTIIK